MTDGIQYKVDVNTISRMPKMLDEEGDEVRIGSSGVVEDEG